MLYIQLFRQAAAEAACIVNVIVSYLDQYSLREKHKIIFTGTVLIPQIVTASARLHPHLGAAAAEDSGSFNAGRLSVIIESCC